MPKFSTSLSGATVLQAGYDTYTDTAGTTPATADGALVAALKSGAVNAVQATGTNRPAIVAGGSAWGLDCLRYDGVDDFLRDAAFSQGEDFTIIAVAYHHTRSTSNFQVIAQVGANTANFYTQSSQLITYDGSVRKSDVAMPNQWGMVGLICGTDRVFINDDYASTMTVGSKVTASTGLTLGAFSTGQYCGRIDVLMYIIFPTTALTTGNLTTLRSELDAYLGSLPLAVPSSKTLVVVEGNSLLSAGCYADLTNTEYTALAAGTRWEMRNIGVPGSTSSGAGNSINARRAWRDGYPASVGRTRENSVVTIGEGHNEPNDAAGFIAEVNYAVSQGWQWVIVVLPTVTSGWNPGDANVTNFYNTVKAYTFAANVLVLDSRQGVLATYNATYFADSVHLSQAGHTALGGFLTTTLGLIPSPDEEDEEPEVTDTDTKTMTTTPQAIATADCKLQVRQGRVVRLTIKTTGSITTAGDVGEDYMELTGEATAEEPANFKVGSGSTLYAWKSADQSDEVVKLTAMV